MFLQESLPQIIEKTNKQFVSLMNLTKTAQYVVGIYDDLAKEMTNTELKRDC